jgi:hypothetical protein
MTSACLACRSDTQESFWTNCQGTYTFPGGHRYVGEFRDGKPNGQGIFTTSFSQDEEEEFSRVEDVLGDVGRPMLIGDIVNYFRHRSEDHIDGALIERMLSAGRLKDTGRRSSKNGRYVDLPDELTVA